jgi:hypothetical protein
MLNVLNPLSSRTLLAKRERFPRRRRIKTTMKRKRSREKAKLGRLSLREKE